MRILRFFRHVIAGEVTKFRKSMILQSCAPVEIIGIWFKVDTRYLRCSYLILFGSYWNLCRCAELIMHNVMPIIQITPADILNKLERNLQNLMSSGIQMKTENWNDDLWYPILKFLARYKNENHDMIMQENLNKAISQ